MKYMEFVLQAVKKCDARVIISGHRFVTGSVICATIKSKFLIDKGTFIMKNNDMVKLQQPELPEEKRDEEVKGTAKRASRAVFFLVALLFAAVMCITYVFEMKFGKTAGTIALVAVALIISLSLYGKELLAKIKRKK